jgi:dinuclear metal center YbgI/SA1388 family protein
MAKLKDIVAFLNNYLESKKIKDSSRNGLQVRGKPEITKIAFTENASLDTFQTALKEKADLIVVHHGLLWKEKYKNPALDRIKQKRIQFLIKNNLSLYASHLPLDKHKTAGNNAQLLKLLGAKIKNSFGEYHGQKISWSGEFKKPVLAKELARRISAKLKTKTINLLFGPKKVKSLAVCSGGGGFSTLAEAINKKFDFYLTGESFDCQTLIKDAGFNVVFAGHYATETLGVKALMSLIEKEFKVKTVFIDDPTGL